MIWQYILYVQDKLKEACFIACWTLKKRWDVRCVVRWVGLRIGLWKIHFKSIPIRRKQFWNYLYLQNREQKKKKLKNEKMKEKSSVNKCMNNLSRKINKTVNFFTYFKIKCIQLTRNSNWEIYFILFIFASSLIFVCVMNLMIERATTCG